MKNKTNAPETVEQTTALQVVKNSEPIVEQKQHPVFMQIVKNLKEENNLLVQWEKLDATEKELDSFTFGGDRLRDSLKISDSEGHAFTTNNSFLIEQAAIKIKELVTEKKAEIENEINHRRLAA